MTVSGHIEKINGLTKEWLEMKNHPYEVYFTAFHGGRLISRHATIEAAERSARKHRFTDCVCGCTGIIGPDQRPGTLADQAIYSDPYAIGMV